jgi:hypothetical protein
MTSTVRLATLEGTQPFTVTSTNTYDDGHGHKYTSSLSITLQPTDENGQALG